MTNLTISTTVAQEVTSPALEARAGQITATSLQVAEHFGKRHPDVLRAIRKLEVSEEFSRCNFAPRDYFDERGKVRDVHVLVPSGVEQRDRAVLQRLRSLLMDGAPPAGLPQPLTILLTPRPDPGADCAPYLALAGAP